MSSRLIATVSALHQSAQYATAQCGSGCCSSKPVEAKKQFDSPYQFEEADIEDSVKTTVYPPLKATLKSVTDEVVYETAVLGKDVLYFTVKESMHLLYSTVLQAIDTTKEVSSDSYVKFGLDVEVENLKTKFWDKYDELLAHPQYVSVKNDVVAHPHYITAMEKFEVFQNESVKHYTFARTFSEEKVGEVQDKVNEFRSEVFPKMVEEAYVTYDAAVEKACFNYNVFVDKYYIPSMQQFVLPKLACVVAAFEKANSRHAGKFEAIQNSLETDPVELCLLVALLFVFIQMVRKVFSMVPRRVTQVAFLCVFSCPCCWYTFVVAPVLPLFWNRSAAKPCAKKCCGGKKAAAPAKAAAVSEAKKAPVKGKLAARK